MKYIKSYNESLSNYEIGYWCKKYGITNYTINPDGSIDVDGDVDMSSTHFYDSKMTHPHGVSSNKIPIKFNKVSGNFYCNYCRLITLEGCPEEVGDDFNCAGNQLTSLEGSPKVVGGNFICYNNNLTSVRGFPEDFEGLLSIGPNPVSEVFKSILYTLGDVDDVASHTFYAKSSKIAHLLNEYDVISLDGKKIYRDNLEEVFNLLGKEIPKDLKLKNYEIH